MRGFGQWLWPVSQPVDWPQPPVLTEATLDEFATLQFRLDDERSASAFSS
jgi:hypothetical protein